MIKGREICVFVDLEHEIFCLDCCGIQDMNFDILKFINTCFLAPAVLDLLDVTVQHKLQTYPTLFRYIFTLIWIYKKKLTLPYMRGPANPKNCMIWYKR